MPRDLDLTQIDGQAGQSTRQKNNYNPQHQVSLRQRHCNVNSTNMPHACAYAEHDPLGTTARVTVGSSSVPKFGEADQDPNVKHQSRFRNMSNTDGRRTSTYRPSLCSSEPLRQSPRCQRRRRPASLVP